MLPHFSLATYSLLGEFCGAVHACILGFRGCTYYASINLLLLELALLAPVSLRAPSEEARSAASYKRTDTIAE